MLFICAIVVIVEGVFYFVFAFRDPPRGVEHFFRIPSIFVFFPENSRVRLGRITCGVLCAGFGAWLMLFAVQKSLRDATSSDPAPPPHQAPHKRHNPPPERTP